MIPSADIGGSICLWLGGSLLTAYEIMDLCGVTFTSTLRKRNKSKMAAKHLWYHWSTTLLFLIGLPIWNLSNTYRPATHSTKRGANIWPQEVWENDDWWQLQICSYGKTSPLHVGVGELLDQLRITSCYIYPKKPTHIRFLQHINQRERYKTLQSQQAADAINLYLSDIGTLLVWIRCSGLQVYNLVNEILSLFYMFTTKIFLLLNSDLYFYP